jgi:hypothetical protein
MKSILLVLPLVLAVAGCPAWAGPVATSLGSTHMSDQRRNDLRDAVEAHRAAKREEVRREEAAMGRRLTPAELAELRAQVRQQWTPRQDLVRSSESQPAERIVPAPQPDDRVLTAPHSQRP